MLTFKKELNFFMERTYLAELKNSKILSEKKRQEVSIELIKRSVNIKNGTIKIISVKDLEILFELYDEIFFNHYFKNFFKGKVDFSLSERMHRSAGKTIVPKKNSSLFPSEEKFEIRIGVDFFFDFNKTPGSKRVSGQEAEDALKALQIVFEHELCHLIEFYVFGNSSCKLGRFKALVNNIFSHTEVFHELPTKSEIIKEKFGFKPGDKVAFTDGKSRYNGIIKSINKRVTVMVQSKKGVYADRSGRRYEKWYVPVENIEM